MKIGVFDSGVGGQSVAIAIEAALPEAEVILREDRDHLPYGTKQPDELLGFVVPIFQSMVDEGCDVIVVACNTVTTTLIEQLRQNFTIPLVAIEPMIKPAAQMTKTKVIAVCATPATLNSQRYKWLKNEYAKDITVLEPECGDWPLMIEENAINEQEITKRINATLDKNADVIVLACTHFHWIEDEINELAKDKATVIQPTTATIEQLKRVISQLQ